ncbi:MAG: hypothetical protein R8M38_03115 [Mariprofundaceae bacterium]
MFKKMERVRGLLSNQSYTFAATEAAKIIELAFRKLLLHGLPKLDEKHRLKVMDAILAIGKGTKGVDSFGLGQMLAVIKRAHFFEAWETATGCDLMPIKMVNFDVLSELRNKLAHHGYEASKFEAEFMFQVLQGFMNTFDILTIDASANNGVQEGWLIGEVELSRLERESTHTWVFSLDLSNDINQGSGDAVIEGHLFQAVHANLIAGNKYTYFVPDTQNLRWAIGEHKKAHAFSEEQVKFVMVPEASFAIVSESVVYNIDAGKMNAVEWLPNGKANFYVLMDDMHMRRLIAYGHSLLDKG